ncbi:MAG: polyprenyl synthetase family protein [Acidimicrobiales bacterium]|nr:polyprenyl synthetase family protein [Hyphomonadaceae bacterium]RZV42088.1 MAG: polyprenyl synthetase family protein [Acidimicrobiales bacterium]
MDAVDAIIRNRMQSPVGMIPDLAEHLVGAGGKRLRPLITIASAHLSGYQGTGHHNLAAAVEFIHSATLLHDDVVDTSSKRRGKKTANLIWGNAPSILVGDFLFARAFNLMVETESMKALEILSTASSVIAEGEVQQLASIGNIDMSESTYRQVIGAKTAALFAAAAEVGPVLAELNDKHQRAMQTYGQELGLAFQLVDDALDYGGFEVALGKSIGDDFREGKMTLPIIYAFDQAKNKNDSDAVAFWTRVVTENAQEDVDLEHAISLLRKEGAIEATLKAARLHADDAIEALDLFEDSEWKSALAELAIFVVDRVH